MGTKDIIDYIEKYFGNIWGFILWACIFIVVAGVFTMIYLAIYKL